MRDVNICLIVAVAENDVVGKDGAIPWNIPSDTQRFSKITKGHVVVMGRKTYESLPKKFRPLPGRISVVVTTQRAYDAPGCIVTSSWEEALVTIQAFKAQIFVIGGEEIYKRAMPYAKAIYYTRVHAEVEGSTFFPQFDEKEWRVYYEHFNPKDENPKDEFETTFLVLVRNSLRGEFVLPSRGRSREMQEKMKKINERGVCPFCPEHILTYHEQPILKDGKHWMVTKNAVPYENSTHSFLLISKRHVRVPHELSELELEELLSFVEKLVEDNQLPGASIVWRFGDIRYTGASVDHLHLHLVSGTGDPTKKIRARIG